MNKLIEEHNQTRLLDEIELPLAKVLSSMECEGFLVDAKGIRAFGSELQIKIEALVDEIYGVAGYEFNLNSPKQLGEALFEKMGLPAGKKTKTGYATDAETLSKLRFHSPIIDLVLQYRAVTKLHSTYVEGLISQIAADGRIHLGHRSAADLAAATGDLKDAFVEFQNNAAVTHRLVVGKPHRNGQRISRIHRSSRSGQAHMRVACRTNTYHQNAHQQ
jgi:DNA polymerase I-like protein with 3'-5' exonuclease and polymerase domains